ncbi:Zinc finger protein ZOP1 [Camellia lanceoleosa]|uniref:Zinc finger protein ZOP1 n=1 Tax=Camellia lanceoleosa TaxID=1840588 RepID=A0ACC0HKL7_9ERIC|nr:Zinc finger protein ZOP1 [Camellia lanceoleosa]
MQPGLQSKAELIEGYISFPRGQRFQCQCISCLRGWSGSVISGEEWVYDSSSGYYCNQNNGCFYDPNSGFYYTDALALEGRSALENKGAAKSQNGALSGSVVYVPLNPKRSVKGAPSSLTVNKIKRQDEKPKVLSEGKAAALKKREATRKRVEERGKPLIGLYRQ